MVYSCKARFHMRCCHLVMQWFSCGQSLSRADAQVLQGAA